MFSMPSQEVDACPQRSFYFSLAQGYYPLNIAESRFLFASFPTRSVPGRYPFFEDEVRFIPTFPFERDLQYHATFDPQLLGAPLTVTPGGGLCWSSGRYQGRQ
jgi:hypothetical protein